jgi:hypothetical protein
MKQVAVAAALGLFALGSTQAAIIYSEDFESYDVPSGSFRSVNAPNTLGGWTVGDAGVDIVSATYGGGWPASGLASLDLNGSNRGSITRTLSGLTVNGQYSLTFDYAANQDGLGVLVGTQRPFDASVGATFASFSSGNFVSFERGQLLFSATSDSMNLVFQSSIDGDRGAILDNIQIAAVPEPHEWAMMLAGLGLVGWAARRRRDGQDNAPMVLS